MIIPQRPYRNLEEFWRRAVTFWKSWAEQHLDKWPCLECKGQGSVYDPEDPPDPIEGNKNRRTIKCQHCGGAGEGTRRECLQTYREAIENYKARKIEWERLFLLKEKALDKLTREEIEALQTLGV